VNTTLDIFKIPKKKVGNGSTTKQEIESVISGEFRVSMNRDRSTILGGPQNPLFIIRQGTPRAEKEQLENKTLLNKMKGAISRDHCKEVYYGIPKE